MEYEQDVIVKAEFDVSGPYVLCQNSEQLGHIGSKDGVSYAAEIQSSPGLCLEKLVMAESVTEFDINDSPKSINDELFGLGMNRENQPQAHITIKTEPTDDELTAIDYNLIGQPTELKVIIKTEPFDHDLSAVSIDEEGQPTVQVVVKTEQPDKVQLSEISTECENVNYFHNEISEEVNDDTIDTKIKSRSEVEIGKHDSKPGQIPRKCPVCSKPFLRLDHYKAHLQTHNQVKNFVFCNVCRKSFESRRHLKKHMVSHERKTKTYWECSICLKWFTTKKYMNFHKANHLNRQKYPCIICNKELSLHISLHFHLYAHKEYLPLRCYVCSRELKWTDETRLKHHNRIANYCRCDICKKFFRKKEDLLLHLLEHYQTCKICNFVSKTPRIHQQHFLKHAREKLTKPYLCERCNKYFKNFQKLKTHICVNGLSRNLLTTQNCSSVSSFHQITKITQSQEQSDHSLSVSDANFFKVGELFSLKISAPNSTPGLAKVNLSPDSDLNISEVHALQVPFNSASNIALMNASKCSIATNSISLSDCGVSTENAENIPNLIQRKMCATSSQPFNNECSKQKGMPHQEMEKKIELQKGIGVEHHNRIANYCRCDICKKFFRKKEDLSLHLLEHYQTCKICNFVSKTPRIHQQHFLKHAREKLTKPYLCERCNKYFKNYQKLKTHICVNGLSRNLLTTQNCSSVSSFHQITKITQSQEQSDHSLSVSDANFFKVGELFSLKISAPNSTPGLAKVNLSPDSDLNISEAHALQVPFNSASNIALMNASKCSIATNSISLSDCGVSTKNAENIPNLIQRTMCATSSQPFNNECSKQKGMPHQEMEKEIELQKGIGVASLPFPQVKGQNVQLKQAEVNSVNVACFTCKVCRKMYKYPLELKNHMKSSRHGYKLKTYYKC